MKWPIYRKIGLEDVSSLRTCMFDYNLNGYRGAIRCMTGLINLGLFGGFGGIDSVLVKSLRIDRTSAKVHVKCVMTKNIDGSPVRMTKEFSSGFAQDEFSVLNAISVALLGCVSESKDFVGAKLRFSNMFNDIDKEIQVDPIYSMLLPREEL